MVAVPKWLHGHITLLLLTIKEGKPRAMHGWLLVWVCQHRSRQTLHKQTKNFAGRQTESDAWVAVGWGVPTQEQADFVSCCTVSVGGCEQTPLKNILCG